MAVIITDSLPSVAYWDQALRLPLLDQTCVLVISRLEKLFYLWTASDVHMCPQ